MSPILGIWASQNYPRVTNSYESIATTTVGAGGTSTITFSSIPSTYKHLQIRAIARKTATGGIENLDRVTLNSDTGANYSDHFLYSTGAALFTNADVNNTFMIVSDSSNNTSGAAANVYAATVLDILDYTNTNKYKTLRSFCGLDNNGSGACIITSGSWRNTAAITTVTITPNANDFMQYSQFALYGIRG